MCVLNEKQKGLKLRNAIMLKKKRKRKNNISQDKNVPLNQLRILGM